MVRMCHNEITKVTLLVPCNYVNNPYQHDSRVLGIFVPRKPSSKLLNILRTNHIYSETFHFRVLIH